MGEHVGAVWLGAAVVLEVLQWLQTEKHRKAIDQ